MKYDGVNYMNETIEIISKSLGEDIKVKIIMPDFLYVQRSNAFTSRKNGARRRQLLYK